jgi:hypothetical protein
MTHSRTKKIGKKKIKLKKGEHKRQATRRQQIDALFVQVPQLTQCHFINIGIFFSNGRLILRQ